MNKYKHVRDACEQKCAASWLTRKLFLYLTGFSNRRKQAKTRKDPLKDGGENYGDAAFTILALTMTPPTRNERRAQALATQRGRARWLRSHARRTAG
jgi:hypothetical protein